MNTAPRVQKALAQAGFGSRRELDRKIQEGRVRVDGRVVRPGDRMIPGARVEIDGRVLVPAPAPAPAMRVLALYKREGLLCSRHAVGGRPSVYDVLPELPTGRWIAVGRLDLNSSGLLLFTTNGELAHRMMHPSYRLDREYAVRVHGVLTRDKIGRLLKGVRLDDGPARFLSLEGMGSGHTNQWYRVVLREGRNRLVRRLWLSQGLMVNRLIRVRFGPYRLRRHCRAGAWLELAAHEVDQLLAAVRLRRVTVHRADS